MIPEALIDEVRIRADIVEIVGQHIQLQRAGKEFRALCPFHQEKTPSFYVVPAKGFYKCFGCGAAGDIFSFLMEHLGLSFVDAVRQLAAEVGVEIPERSAEREEDDPNRLLYEAIAFAADFYHHQLLETEPGHAALRYLEGRGIGREVVERFQLGYAPDTWRALREAAHQHGIDDEVLLAAGLIKEPDRAGEPYDRQRNRVTFPITDHRGRVIAFGGRALVEGERIPKYLNSPETPIYHKGLHLYGLSWAKGAIRREKTALVVEGYMDYVALAAHGIENVVAGLGTAMTLEQAELLSRYTTQALLLYDSDPAGLRATFRTADALLGVGVHPLIVTLPRGEDPDSVVRAGGAKALEPHLDAAIDVIDRKIQILETRDFFTGSERVREAIDRLLPTLRVTLDPMLRDIYLRRIAERTGVRLETLEAELAAKPAPTPQRAERRREHQGWRRRREPMPEVTSAQRKLLLLILRDEKWVPAVAEHIDPKIITDPVDRELYEELIRRGGMDDGGPLGLELSPEARARLEELLADQVELGDPDRVFNDTVGDLRAQALFQRKDELMARLEASEGAEQITIFRELLEVTESLRKLGSELRGLGFKLSKRYRRYLTMDS